MQVALKGMDKKIYFPE
jgi:hypothetical protein